MLSHLNSYHAGDLYFDFLRGLRFINSRPGFDVYPTNLGERQVEIVIFKEKASSLGSNW